MTASAKRRVERERRDDGFTLIEALAALALTGLIVFALGTVTAQWLPNWNRGLTRLQSADLLDVGIEHVVDDLTAAEFMTFDKQPNHPFFVGDEFTVVFVRAALDPNTPPRLDVVRLAETDYKDGPTMVRTHAPFVPATGTNRGAKFDFVDPVVLVHAPYRVSFAYAGTDRIWRNSWHDLPSLPGAVRIDVRDAATNRLLSASTAILIHDDISPDCARQNATGECGGQAPKPAAATPIGRDL